MTMRTRFLAPLLLLPILAQAQLYRWTDETGNVHFSDRIPPAGAKNVQKKIVPAQNSSATLPYALQQAAGNFPVTLYTSAACHETCASAREVLDKRGVPYSEVIVSDESDLAKLKNISGDHAVPVMTVGREVYKGFESGRYKVALDTAGYPASSLLPPGVQARTLVAKPAPKPAPAAAPAASPPATETESAAATAPQETADTSGTPVAEERK